MAEIYPSNPVQRLVDTVVPRANTGLYSNPVLLRLAQIERFGGFGAGCSPQHAGVKLRESFAHIPAPHLIQNINHAKSWITEHVTTYIDGELPVWLRKPKFVVDLIKMLQYFARIVATLEFLQQLVQKEIGLANAWANEGLLMLNFARTTLSSPGLRIQAEAELAAVLDVAASSLAQQISENNSSIRCLI